MGLIHIASPAKLSLFLLSLLIAESKTDARAGGLLSGFEKEIIEIVDRVKPSVVTVSATLSYTVKEIENSENRFSFRREKPLARPIQMTTIGTGIVVDAHHILTRLSVIQDSDSIEITLHDGRKYPADKITTDRDWGFGLLRVRDVELAPARLAKEFAIQAGCWAITVGNSLGVAPSVSFGMINGVRPDGLLQISAEAAAGSIGSPVFNAQGEWIGVIAAKISPADENSLAFGQMNDAGTLAFPVELMVDRLAALREGREYRPGWMGVSATNSPTRPSDIIISDLVINGPAAQAGLAVGDVVKHVDNRLLTSAVQMARYISSRRVGDTITLDVQRGDSTLVLAVVLADKPKRESLSASTKPPLTAATPSPSAASRRELIRSRLKQMEKEIDILRQLLE